MSHYGLRRVRVTREVPAERGPGFGFRTFLDAALPASRGLRAPEDPSSGFVPGRERRASGVDVGETLAHFVAPRALDLGLGKADAVEELKREDGALLVRKGLGVLEELVGSSAHAQEHRSAPRAPPADAALGTARRKRGAEPAAE